MTNVAVLGLSADPPHKGHIKVAEALQDMGYDRVMFMVTPHNPFKRTSETEYTHRMALTRILVGRRTWLDVSDAEAWMNLYGEELRTHTVLANLKKLYPTINFTFVVGADNWMQFHEWGKYRDIFKLASVLAIPRPGSGKLEDYITSRKISDLKDKKNSGVVTQGTWRIYNLAVGGSGSSSKLRRDLSAKNQAAVKRWLTQPQLDYIKANKLYGI